MAQPTFSVTIDHDAARPFVHVNIGSGRIFRACAGLPGLCRLWVMRHRERRVLGELDDRLLRDIGATRADAVREAETPFWR